MPGPENHVNNRIRFITHQGKSVLLVDLTNCTAAEVGVIARRVPEFVTAEPLGSALVLGDFTGAQFDREAIDSIKESAVFDRPHIRKSAWVGLENLPHVLYENMKSFTRRTLPTFKTREEALDWLVKE